MSAPTDRNRLDETESPYLRQHAENPVNWQPWDEAARAAARERDVPIFLSIGYSACHWCHVMAEESFEDDAVAEVLNEEFVPIKVDREERPDLDRIYQTICQRVTGHGGWPLSVFLTPDGRPFYVGTYFPKEPRRGSPGFLQLLSDVGESWTEDREEIESRADEWSEAIRGELEASPTPAGGEEMQGGLLDSAAQTAVRGADREHGGWGRGQKFPHSGRIHLLLRAHTDTGHDPFREVATEALDAMANGGMYDQLGGGFHRYATDRQWTVPHFEKMLYDNAELPRVYLAGYQVTADDRYATVARETFDFLTRELQDPGGGFYSSLDARSEGEEGAFYVWSPDQIRDAVDGEREADLFCERHGITVAGNFEGRSVLTLDRTVSDLASAFEMDEASVRAHLDRAKDQVLTARRQRDRPARDDKILAGWNGLAISALAEGSIVLDESYGSIAADALSFVRGHLWDGDSGRLNHRYADGVVKIDGYLEDYAFLGRGALDLFQATGDEDHLVFARDLAREIESRFWDPDDATLYFTPVDSDQLVARPQEITDQSTPSSTGLAVDLLAQLDHFVNHDRFGKIATETLDTQSALIQSNPLQHVSLALARDRWMEGDLELTLVADDPPDEWTRTLRNRYIPRRLLAWRPPALDPWLEKFDLDDPPAIWAGREQQDGKPTVYACKSFTCSPPRFELATALDWASTELDASSDDAPF